VICAWWIVKSNRLIIKFDDDHIGSKSSLFFDHCIDRSGEFVTGQWSSIDWLSLTFNVTKFDAFGRNIGGPRNRITDGLFWL